MSVEAESRELLLRYQADPILFCREVLRFHPWSSQARVLESVRDHSATSVASCHGAGKTAVAARAALWFLSAFPNSRVVTTAPTQAQLRDVLWREIAAAHRDSRGFIGGELTSTRLEIGPSWFCVGLATDSPERFQGHHSEHLLLVVDEASGVGEEIFEAASGFLTSPNSRMLLISNPTRTSGEFYASFHANRAFYNTIRISAHDCPAFTGERVSRKVARSLVTRKWVEQHTAKWGEGSPLWQVRIGAEFPSTSDDSVVSLGDLEQAQNASLEPGLPLWVSCDVARFGSDETVLAVRAGRKVRIAKTYSGRNLMRTVGEITRLARELEKEHGVTPKIVVDDVGVGGGVTDRLRELKEFEVVAYLGSNKARHGDDYPNRRSEDWFELSEKLSALDIEADEQLAADLLAPRYTVDSQGRRVVEAKGETKRRLRRSPDRADAVVMVFAVDRQTGSPARLVSAHSQGRHPQRVFPAGELERELGFRPQLRPPRERTLAWPRNRAGWGR